MTLLDERRRDPLADRLRAADPARTISPYDDSAAAEMLRHATASTGTAPQTRPAGRPRRGRRLAWAAAAAAIALAAVPSVVDLPGLGRVETASPAAAAILEKAADAAISTKDPVAAARQYYRITTRSTSMSTQVGSGPGDDVVWRTHHESTEYVAVDGTRPSYRVERSTTDPEQISGPPTQPWAESKDHRATARTMNLSPVDIPGAWQVPTPAWLASLPRETGALRERMYADAAGKGPSHDGEVLVIAADALRSGLVPADLRSALFRVLRTVPGVEVTSGSVTLDGRTGVGIGRTETANGLRQEIILDPTTGDVIGERDVVAAPLLDVPMPVGSTYGERSVTRTVVDAIPADVLAMAKHSECKVIAGGGVECTMADDH